jgi:CDP-paratose 2-epimerase
MKVLITGGCGFLGSNIAASYLKEGCNVFIVDALFRQGGAENLQWLKDQSAPGQLVFLKADLADAGIVNGFFQQHGPFDYVCHLGGQVAMTTSLQDPRRDMMTNVVGTFNVLEAVRSFSPEALVAYSSTNKVYGDLESFEYKETPSRYVVDRYAQGFDESLPLDFASPYGCSKGGADQYVRDWHRNFGLKTVVFRHSSIYGGRQFSTYDQGWIGWFCQQAIAQAGALAKGSAPVPFTISGTGKQVRDVLHAEDLIRLYHSAYTNRSRISGQIFNIGGGAVNSLSLLELFQLLEELLELKSPLVYERLPRRKSDQNYFVADIQKAETLLNWSPCVSSRKGILRMLDWVRIAGR